MPSLHLPKIYKTTEFRQSDLVLFLGADGQISSQPPMVSLLDHGFLFGDSLYEAIRIYHGKLFAYQEHLDRMVFCGRRIGLDIEPLLSDIRTKSEAMVRSFGKDHACLRIFVTRGIGKLHIDPKSCTKPQVFMAIWAFEAHLSPESMTLMIPEIRRCSRESLDPAIKSGNYLNNVLAYREASRAGFDDALMLNSQGEVTELTTSNIGWIRRGQIETPHTDVGILHGITRKILMEIQPVDVGRFPESILKEASEVFAISTFKEIVPVKSLRLSSQEILNFPTTGKALQLRTLLHAEVERRLKSEKSFLEGAL